MDLDDPSAPAPRVLVLDGDRGPLHETTNHLIELGYHPLACKSPWRALEILGRWPCSAVLLDLHVANLGGLGFLDGIRLVSAPARPAVIALSAVYQADDELNETLRDWGVSGFLTKPLDPITLERVLRSAVSRPAPLPPPRDEDRRSGWRWPLDWDGYVLTDASMVRCHLVEGGDRGLRLKGPAASLLPPGERVVVRAGPPGTGLGEITLHGVVAWSVDGPDSQAGIFLAQASPRRDWLASAEVRR